MNEREANTGGRLTVDANAGENLALSVDDPDANVYVTRSRRTPLSVSEPHAKLKITAEDAVVEVELDGEQLDAVVDGLYHAQQFHMVGGPDGG